MGHRGTSRAPWIAGALLVGFASSAATADRARRVAPGRGGYLGAEACASCHPAAMAVWRDSGHAAAGVALTVAERARRACQACHSTGDAPATPAAWSGVGCEACHGAGAEYAADDVMRDPTLASALGLKQIAGPSQRAALCRSCHDDAIGLGEFDVEAGWKRIAH